MKTFTRRGSKLQELVQVQSLCNLLKRDSTIIDDSVIILLSFHSSAHWNLITTIESISIMFHLYLPKFSFNNHNDNSKNLYIPWVSLTFPPSLIYNLFILDQNTPTNYAQPS